MDFLAIRKKARERAAARAAAGPTSAAAPAPEPPADAPGGVASAAAVLAGRVQAMPEPDPARFTTWRPGEPPPVPIDPSALPAARPGPASPPPLPAPAVEVRPPAAPAARDPLDAFFYRPDEEAPELPELGWAAGGAPAPLEPGQVSLDEFLTFALGAEEYAVPVERVQEVLRPPPLTEVPRAPAPVLGVVTVRGRVVAVIDPRARLGLPAPRDTGEDWRLVIVDAGDGPCGFRVDAISSVVRLPAGSLEPSPQGIGGDAAECLLGIGRERDRLFTVIDPAALVRRSLAAPRRAEGGQGGGA
ncbi:CheW protein [Anaeromyxobacter dehalogenans 2CP-1]|uniref:CheW protein n=1 Tax=Anaeromyxobacter dehalogenans (strain ATCC BAA-258 / DSM 21875 / 2CP-1) TaxID=455488 RepID=B8JEV9_ANAD2|nr:chemotaxis protein CheW [Anaeromyxobacter dehalogenans]ACL66255.1 CheW protein [Anaeromyxobacter dehalogenans 2CP-1]